MGPKTPRKRRVILVGDYTPVGAHCLDMLLADPAFEQVTVISPRPVEHSTDKLTVIVADFDKLSDFDDPLPESDVLLCCMGTGRWGVKTADQYRQLNYHQIRDIAIKSSRERVPAFIMISRLGANHLALSFSRRTQAKAETAVRSLPFRTVHVLRPAMLKGGGSWHPVPSLVRLLLLLFGPLMVGPLRRLRPVPSDQVAAMMVHLAKGRMLGYKVHYPILFKQEKALQPDRRKN